MCLVSDDFQSQKHDVSDCVGQSASYKAVYQLNGIKRARSSERPVLIIVIPQGDPHRPPGTPFLHMCI